MKKIELEEAHSILLETAKEFHNICVKHNIPYYMLGGTMLGAIRHKGFIPWDDDMDFGIPREYFKMAINILRNELPSHYSILDIHNSSSVINGSIKISDNRTIIHEIFKENACDDFGLNIDLFPLDITPNIKYPGLLINLLLKIQSYRFLSFQNCSFWKKLVSCIIKTSLFFLQKKHIINFIENNFTSVKGNYVANHYGAWGIKETHHIDIMGVPKLYSFEDIKLYGIEYYDEYLSLMYKDYMKLPPANKRHIHLTQIYWK